MLAEHPVHDGIHLVADADGLHHLDAQALDEIARDDDLADDLSIGRAPPRCGLATCAGWHYKPEENGSLPLLFVIFCYLL